MLAASGTAPDDDGWALEVKFDGMRALIAQRPYPLEKRVDQACRLLLVPRQPCWRRCAAPGGG